MFNKYSHETALKVEYNGDYRITHCLAWIAVSAGSSPSMVSNAMILSPLMALFTFIETTAKQTSTCTKQHRLQVTARE